MTDWQLHYHDDDSWSAVYKDGKLVNGPGDTYLRLEYLLSELGVKEVHDGAFMLGQSRVSGAAQTLEEITEYRVRRDGLLEKAASLRAEADALVRQAQGIEKELK